ncbi:Na(+)/H(+) antiporter [Renibacterium salmoninarum ATCC 33209]|uniref:Na(+)/H(+) antiporter n=1 Tax=Renibacterium salmoninarum (strain ATCC 33209 / DSM 20767 / JCM 11484 / NBRC 15589 / NCIMB 2235) TaxID=288705 RepID=A9WV50_RENSM|nr:sodium:proton antiporter [Renibacterium salmoninarum]ABY25071.1 Na(+)/H(+) antiporter [Renibacterium salmoninarum ATCC 33209]
MDLEQLLILLVAALAVTAFARKVGWPAPLLVTGVAILVSFFLVDEVKIDSEVILTIVLPPLLYSAALDVSFQDFRTSLRQIRRLGIGLVVITALVVGGVANILIGDISLAAALLLGAIVAPPDAVSATAIGKKLGLPRRVMTVLSGESLINDAAALTMFTLFLNGATKGSSFGFNDGLLLLLINIVGGVGVGLVLAFIVQFVRTRIKDPLIETVIGLLVPFGAYLIAEELHGSGVLAVVAAGLHLGYNAPKGSYVMRLQEQPILASLDVLLEAFVFALIGRQFKNVLFETIDSPRGLGVSLGIADILRAITILIRPAYVFVSYYRRQIPVFKRRRQRRGRDEPEMSWRDLTVISWTGMRGVVTLAAAASVVASSDVEAKDLIFLTAFVVTIGTLLLQGLTLPWLIKKLEVSDPNQEQRDQEAEQALMSRTFKIAMEQMKPTWQKLAAKVGPEKAEKLMARIQGSAAARMSAMQDVNDDASVAKTAPFGKGGIAKPEMAQYMTDMRRQMNELRRKVLIEERDKGNLDDEVMRTVLMELDTEEFALDKSWQSRMRS